MSDKSMNAIQDSRMAQLAYSFFKKELDIEQTLILNNLKQMARDKKHDQIEYAGGMVAMNALDNLSKRLLKQITLGNKVEEGLSNGSKI
jgi:hypothetical protein